MLSANGNISYTSDSLQVVLNQNGNSSNHNYKVGESVMDNHQHLEYICHKFKAKEFDVEEFQSRFETASFPDYLKKLKQGILEDLEEIRFTKLEEQQYDHGVAVVDKLLSNL